MKPSELLCLVVAMFVFTFLSFLLLDEGIDEAERSISAKIEAHSQSGPKGRIGVVESSSRRSFFKNVMIELDSSCPSFSDRESRTYNTNFPISKLEEKRIESIPGVEFALSRKHSIEVFKGDLFDWERDGIHQEIFNVLREAGLE